MNFDRKFSSSTKLTRLRGWRECVCVCGGVWWNEAGILCRVPDSPMPSSSSDFLRWQESSFSRISITDISDGGRASSAPAARMRRKFGSAEVEGGSGPPGSRFMFVTCDGPSSCYN